MTMSIDALYCDLLLDLGLDHWSGFQPDPWDSLPVVAKKAMARSFTKKYRDRTSPDADKVALGKFLSSNERCGTWQLKCESLLDEMLLGQFKYWTWKFFKGNDLEPLITAASDILSLGRNGPGASLGVKTPSFYTKLFSSPLTATSSGLHGMYTNYVNRFPYWREAEQTRQTLYGVADVVAGNRMSFVPKDVTTSRSICTEPVLNMFYQLGIGAVIEGRLREVFSLDVSTQPTVNESLARTGSLCNDLSTLDLSSASDLMSMRMLSWCLPAPFKAWLDICRSPRSDITGYGEVELNMVSTMGNGFTFPLMTALLSCVVAACMDIDGLKRVDNPRSANLFHARTPNWGVFGDDIIVPKRVTSKVRRLLTLLGFEVNSDKSFEEGHFRESCGFDAWKGVNVRGVYVKTLKTTQDRYTVINQLLAWSHRHGIPVERTIGRLMRSVPRYAVPAWEAEDCGIRVPHRFLLLSGMRPRTSVSGSFLYKRWVPRDRRISIFEDYEAVPTTKDIGPVGYNPAGLLLSFVAGYLEGATEDSFRKERVVGQIRVKPNLVRFSLRTGVAPSWDFHPTVVSPYRDSLGGGDLNWSPVLSTLLRTWS